MKRIFKTVIDEKHKALPSIREWITKKPRTMVGVVAKHNIPIDEVEDGVIDLEGMPAHVNE